MGKIAFIFPGQGAQYVGMGKDLYENIPAARDIFERADSILGFELSRICFEGPDDTLSRTDIQQPAIFTVSAAALEALKESKKLDKGPDFAAGLSLGEYTAYYAAEALDFESALRLVHARGRFMQQASEDSDGAMISIIGLDEEKVLKICKEAAGEDVLVAANFNCPGQIVLSGTRSACIKAAELAEREGAIKVVKLEVAGAFHSPLMQPAANRLKEMLDKTEFRKPKVAVISNVDAEIYTEPDKIRNILVKQLTSSTYWEKCIRKLLSEGVDQFFEIGPGRTLTGMLKRIDRKANIKTIGTISDIQNL